MLIEAHDIGVDIESTIYFENFKGSNIYPAQENTLEFGAENPPDSGSHSAKLKHQTKLVLHTPHQSLQGARTKKIFRQILGLGKIYLFSRRKSGQIKQYLTGCLLFRIISSHTSVPRYVRYAIDLPEVKANAGAIQAGSIQMPAPIKNSKFFIGRIKRRNIQGKNKSWAKKV